MKGQDHQTESTVQDKVRLEVGVVLIVVLRVISVHSVKNQETDHHRGIAQFQGPRHQAMVV